ncbi:MAG: dynamin family protein [Pseudomonadota bacterium]
MSNLSESPLSQHLAPRKGLTQAATDIAEGRSDLSKELLKLEGAVMPEEVPTIAEIMEHFDGTAVRVSLIGQVKAGKTALANALLGVSNLLPSDVNPWTSVVTSFHVNRPAPKGKSAVFKFFDQSDWDDLVSNSGRIVELAKKAHLDTKLDELTEQIEDLKSRTEARLGRNFSFLLGSQHAFSKYNSDLIKRYVCLGDADIAEEKEGRFADLTKSADLYSENEDFAYPITIADTPGVNDPFLIREAATLNNLGDSDICIVVLSAHQALSSVDVGLMRMLKSLRANRLIVFVNRIDELAKPHEQIQEIREHIVQVLQNNRLTGDIPIVFGSAAWAEAAILGDLDCLPEDSIESLKSLVDARTSDMPFDAQDDENTNGLFDVTGISALRAAIDHKAQQEVFQPEIARIANHARRIAERSSVYLKEAGKSEEIEPNWAGMKRAVQDLKLIRDKCDEAIAAHRENALHKVQMGMSGAYVDFSKREKDALLACIQSKGKIAEWSPDTEKLRSELNAIYFSFANDARAFFKEMSQNMARVVDQAYSIALGSHRGVKITPLPVSEPPVPLTLMRTMSIDLRAGSSIEWIKRKLDKSVYVKQFEDITKQDFRTNVDETCADNVEVYMDLVGSELLNFLDDHRRTIEGFKDFNDGSMDEQLSKILNTDGELLGRLRTLRDTSDVLYALETAETDEADEVSEEKSVVNG